MVELFILVPTLLGIAFLPGYLRRRKEAQEDARPISGRTTLVDAKDGALAGALYLGGSALAIGFLITIWVLLLRKEGSLESAQILIGLIFSTAAAVAAFFLLRAFRDVWSGEPGQLVVESWPLRTGTTATAQFSRVLRGTPTLQGLTANLVLIEIVQRGKSVEHRKLQTLPVHVAGARIRGKVLRGTLTFDVPPPAARQASDRQFWQLDILSPLSTNPRADSTYILHFRQAD